MLRRPAAGTEWAQECDFVGHSDPVVCAAFNPRTFRRAAPAASAANGGAGNGAASTGAEGGRVYSCCALGGQDCTLSLWLTSSPKPLVVVRKIFEQDVLDLSWSADGCTLLACSMDGTLACVQLEATEIGVPVGEDEQRALLTRLYGSAVHAPPSAMVVESAAMLALERQRAAACAAKFAATGPSAGTGVVAGARPGMPTAAAAAGCGGTEEPSTKQVLALQKEVRTHDGKRRIMPVSMDGPSPLVSTAAAPPPACGAPAARPTVTSLTSQPSRTTVSFTPCAAAATSSSAPSISFTPGVTGAPPFGGVEPGGPSPRPAGGACSAGAGNLCNSAPSFATMTQPAPYAASAAAEASQLHPPSTAAAFAASQPPKRPPVLLPAGLGVQGSGSGNAAASKRARVGAGAGAGRGSSGGAASSMHSRFNGAQVDHAAGGGSASCGGDGGLSAGLASAAAAAAAAGLLAVLPAAPVPAGALALELPEALVSESGGGGADGGGGSGFAQSAFTQVAPRTLEAAPASSSRRVGNGSGASSLIGGSSTYSSSSAGSLGAECLLTCSWQGEVLWSAALPSAVTLLAGNSCFAACACADGSVYIFTAAGRRAAPPLLPCAGGVAALSSDLQHSLMVVGCQGDVVVYSDLPQQPRCSLRCSAAPLLSRAGRGSVEPDASSARLLDAALLSGGRPLLLLPHGAFTYADGLQSWLSMGDEAFGLSEHRSSLPPTLPYASPSALPPSVPLAAHRLQPSCGPPSLAALQGQHGLVTGRFERSAAGLASALASAPSDHQRLVSTAHLEHQMAAALALGNPSEYREWLRAYAHALGQQFAVRQVRELCDELLGPMIAPTADATLPNAATAAASGADSKDGNAIAVSLSWSPTVLGLCKRTLLREAVLPSLATNRSLQRILAEYIECLGAL